MGGCGPGAVIDFGFGLKQGHGVVTLRTCQCRNDADGAATRDDDAGFLHWRRTFGLIGGSAIQTTINEYFRSFQLFKLFENIRSL